MKWVELVRVRSSVPSLTRAMPALRALVADLGEADPGAEAQVLRHGLYDGDLAVVVVWRTETAPAKSRAGVLVAEWLQRLGPVDHAVWVPTEPGP